MIQFPREILKRMKTEALEAYPEECCGLLVGTREADGQTTVTKAVPSRNMRTDNPHKRFEVDPRIHFEVLKSTRDTEEKIIGHYHSHPDHPPLPSETDLKMALDPELVWIILGVAKSTVSAVNAFALRPDGSGFDPEPLRELP